MGCSKLGFMHVKRSWARYITETYLYQQVSASDLGLLRMCCLSLPTKMTCASRMPFCISAVCTEGHRSTELHA